jgi:acetyl-CoA carboxylase carboxyl transferase subunit beta
MSDIFSKQKPKLRTFLKGTEKSIPKAQIDIPDGLFIACEQCHAALYQKALIDNLSVCPHCRFHFRLNAQERIALVCDASSFKPSHGQLTSSNPLNMPDYDKKLVISKQNTGLQEAFVSGEATINEVSVAIGVLDSFFMMGSMGSVVGEKITRLIDVAINKKLPLIIFSASGGARMQEGILSLMQMVKTSAALKRLDQAGGLFLSVMTHPTTGGVAASYASLGDIILAEYGALIGFAGARVIKQTIQQDLPEGFQTADFQLKHGQVDLVVERQHLKQTLTQLLAFHTRKETSHATTK